MYSLFLTIPGLPKTTNSSFKNNWRAQWARNKRLKALVTATIGNNRPARPLTKARITLERHSSKEPDFDGLVSSFKSCIDALTENEIILDDKYSIIGQPIYKWVKASPRNGFITIKVEEITDEANI